MTVPGSAPVESGMDAGRVLLYHVMRADEGFDETAEMLFSIIRQAALACPGRQRTLFLDIDGHRPNRTTGYDHDALEILSSFVLGFLFPWLAEINTPLFKARASRPQRDDLPDRIHTIEVSMDLEETREVAVRIGMPVFHSDTGAWVGGEEATPHPGGEAWVL